MDYELGKEFRDGQQDHGNPSIILDFSGVCR